MYLDKKSVLVNVIRIEVKDYTYLDLYDWMLNWI